MVLSDTEILKEIHEGSIKIEPFDRECLGSNSYDVHLAPHLMCYDTYLIDCKLPTPYTHYYIPPEGFILDPNKLYLASTIEYTETHSHLSILEGKSSLGRLGLSIHITAGKGDVGFCNHWTLELWCLIPIRIYAGMPIGQLIYHEVKGFVQRPYNEKASAKYNDRDPLPQPSKFYKNF